MDVDFATLYGCVLQLNCYLQPLLDLELADKNEFYKKVKGCFTPGTSKAAVSGVSGQWTSIKGHGAG